MAQQPPGNDAPTAYQLAQQLVNAIGADQPELRARAAAIAHDLRACRHGPDFACALWHGTLYHFTAAQGAVVRTLWEPWEMGVPDVRQETLLLAAEVESDRLADIFRDNPAWGTMIVPGKARGTYRLADPA